MQNKFTLQAFCYITFIQIMAQMIAHKEFYYYCNFYVVYFFKISVSCSMCTITVFYLLIFLIIFPGFCNILHTRPLFRLDVLLLLLHVSTVGVTPPPFRGEKGKKNVM